MLNTCCLFNLIFSLHVSGHKRRMGRERKWPENIWTLQLEEEMVQVDTERSYCVVLILCVRDYIFLTEFSKNET